MSILIKGMEMPTDCDNCSLFDDRFDYPSCNATGHSRGYNWNPRGQRMPDCPLIEVPEDVQPVKHGKNLKEEYPTLFQCSVCGCEDWDTSEVNYGEYNYCPNCGAKMNS